MAGAYQQQSPQSMPCLRAAGILSSVTAEPIIDSIMERMKTRSIAILLLLALLAGGQQASAGEERSLTVTASAYNSLKSQTSGNPSITAWGDELKPGMKVIAVSRDLLKMGLKHNTRVKIDGLPGTYLVKDKMHRRWQRKIDIYMGDDVKAAHRWGKRKVTIRW